jgi:hypothetical protein
VREAPAAAVLRREGRRPRTYARRTSTSLILYERLAVAL